MGCRCAERRDAIIKAAVAVAAGDMDTVRAQAALVARTAAEDATAAFAHTKARAAALLAARRR